MKLRVLRTERFLSLLCACLSHKASCCLHAFLVSHPEYIWFVRRSGPGSLEMGLHRHVTVIISAQCDTGRAVCRLKSVVGQWQQVFFFIFKSSLKRICSKTHPWGWMASCHPATLNPGGSVQLPAVPTRARAPSSSVFPRKFVGFSNPRENCSVPHVVGIC